MIRRTTGRNAGRNSGGRDSGPTGEPTYPELGATRDGQLPAGYSHLRRRTRVGDGPAAFTAVADGLMRWDVLRGAGLRVSASDQRVRRGAYVVSSVGFGGLRLPAPCRVVWTVEQDRRVGFGYGTLPGHPESGEEAFVVERDDTDAVWFTVTSFSRPARWYSRLGSPILRLGVRVITRRYLSAARRLAGGT